MSYERPPGSFPTDDMAPGDAERARGPNKLHKPNDPRGQTGSNQPALTDQSVENAYAPAEGYEKREEHARTHEAARFGDEQPGKEDTTHYQENPSELGTTAGTIGGGSAGVSGFTGDDSTGNNTVRTGNQDSSVDHKDPYWGDLPTQQGGIHNTVAGHGSDKDDTGRYHSSNQPVGHGSGTYNTITGAGSTRDAEERQAPSAQTLPQGQGTYNTVAGHGSQQDDVRRGQSSEYSNEGRSFPLVTDRTREQTHGDSTYSQQQQQPLGEQKDDSHWKETGTGAAFAGAAGAAAYKAKREQSDEKHDHTTGPIETEDDKEKKKHGGGLFGVFKRDKDSKDDEKDHHKDHKKDHHKDHKDHKHEDKTYQSKEDKIAPAAAAGAYKRPEEQRRDEQTHDNRDRTAVAGVGAGAAAAAASAAYTGHSGDHRTENRDTTSHAGSAPAAQANQGQYNVLGSGTPSGVRVDDGSSTSGRGTGTGTGTGTGLRDTLRSSGTDTSDPSNDSKRNAMYGAGAGAAGLGAAGVGAHYLNKDRDDKTNTLGQDRDNTTRTLGQDRDAPTENTTSRSGGWFTGPAGTSTQTQPQTQTRADPATKATDISGARDPARETYPSGTSQSSTAAAGLGAAGLAGAGAGAAGLASHHGNSGSQGQHALREPSSEVPRATEIANEGQYNVLSSGTPSGINVKSDQYHSSHDSSAPRKLPSVDDVKGTARSALGTTGASSGTAGQSTSGEECTAAPLLHGQTGPQ